VEAPYLSLFEALGKGLGLPHCYVKMLFTGFPLSFGKSGPSNWSPGSRTARISFACVPVATKNSELWKMPGVFGAFWDFQ
jgi:hypothetical protein